MIGAMILAAAVAGADPQVQPAVFAPLSDVETRRYGRLAPAGPFYPARAAEAKLSGEAVLECRVGKAGSLKACKPLGERPGGWSFGAAAKVMAERGRISVADTPPEGSPVWIHVPFRLEPSARP